METAAKIPVCFSMKRYKRRKKYQRLKRSSTNAEDYYDEKEAISMLEAADQYQYHRKGNSWKSKGMVIPKVSGKNTNVEPLRKWRDAYEEMMLCFAARYVHEVETSGLQRDSTISRGLMQIWRPAAPGFVKLNVDASFDSNTNEEGLGAVLRDANGTVIICATSRINLVPDSLFAEMYAIHFGLIVANYNGFLDCFVENDSLVAIRELRKFSPCFLEGGILVGQVRELAALFRLIEFKHVIRMCNRFAYNLAHSDCSVELIMFDMEFLYTFVTQILIK
ncbi:hypothetical protein CCACVL1_03522 [Corchorus capsularis]|uniref:RNase H type-1 domain-containing protein n=1 Tax=Corchorus capsularis TaxID=210143 RepID=A0A1R3JYS5_COCAP|nr:hypothetical protein CCACVL1_03522 [Corchorus capsularis]